MNYSEEKLKKYLSDKEIEVILFDLDDTLIDTNPVFVDKINSVLRNLSKSQELDYRLLKARFEAELLNAHKIVVVNPEKLWPTILAKCKEVYGWEEGVTEEAFKGLMEIYTTLPKVLPGTIPTLEEIKATEKFMGLVSHASWEWTDFKLKGLGLGKFFQHVELFDINIHKCAAVWESAIKAFKVQPKNTLVVGDNVKGDMQAACKAGVRNLVWMNRDEAWSHYKKGKLPEGTIEIGGMDELLDRLCENV